jgi:anti-sigma28 factor (negative regulator of flagellin synthesis)
MKIDAFNNPWLSSVEQPKTQGPQTAARQSEREEKPGSFPEDSVKISHPGIEDVQTEKITGIQRAIANGAYQVAATDIADAMLRDWRG